MSRIEDYYPSRKPRRPRRAVPDPGALAFAEEFGLQLEPKLRHVVGKYAEIEARRNAGESAEALAAEFGVPVDCVNDLQGWPVQDGWRSS